MQCHKIVYQYSIRKPIILGVKNQVQKKWYTTVQLSLCYYLGQTNLNLTDMSWLIWVFHLSYISSDQSSQCQYNDNKWHIQNAQNWMKTNTLHNIYKKSKKGQILSNMDSMWIGVQPWDSEHTFTVLCNHDFLYAF